MMCSGSQPQSWRILTLSSLVGKTTGVIYKPQPSPQAPSPAQLEAQVGALTPTQGWWLNFIGGPTCKTVKCELSKISKTTNHHKKVSSGIIKTQKQHCRSYLGHKTDPQILKFFSLGTSSPTQKLEKLRQVATKKYLIFQTEKSHPEWHIRGQGGGTSALWDIIVDFYSEWCNLKYFSNSLFHSN